MRITNTHRLTPSINAALAEPAIRRRLDGARTLDDLLDLWDEQDRPLRWQADKIGQLTSGSTEAPAGIWPNFRTVGKWQAKRRPLRLVPAA